MSSQSSVVIFGIPDPYQTDNVTAAVSDLMAAAIYMAVTEFRAAIYWLLMADKRPNLER